MNVLNKVTWNTLKKNKTRTIVTIIGVILSAAMITAVTTFVSSMQDFMIRASIESEGNWYIRFSNMPAGSLTLLEQEKKIEATALRHGVGYAEPGTIENKDKPYLYLEEFTAGSFDMLAVRIAEGRLPKNSNELLIPEHLLSTGGAAYRVGDTITLDIGNRVNEEGESISQNISLAYTEGKEQLINTASRTFTIVGICKRPKFESFAAPGYTIMTVIDASALAPNDRLAAYIRTTSARDGVSVGQALYKSMNDNTVEFKSGDILDYMGYGDNNSLNSVLYSMAAILLTLIAVGSISLIYNAFAISVSERSKLFGMLSGIGASARQIRNSVFYEAAVIGAVGLPLGILSGVTGIGVTLKLLSGVIRDSFGTSSSGAEVEFCLAVYPLAIVAAVIVGFVTILISAYIPARRAAKSSAIDAMRQTQDIRLKARAVRTPRFIRKLFGMEGDLALKNFRRNRRRYRATVFSLFISVVLFISASAFTENMKVGTEAVYTDQNYDMMISLEQQTTDEDLTILADTVSHLDSCKQLSSIRAVYGWSPVDKACVPPEVYAAEDSYTPLLDDGRVQIRYLAYALGRTEFERYVSSLGLNLDEYSDPQHPKGIVIDWKRLYTAGKYTVSELFIAKPTSFALNEFSSDDGSEPAMERMTEAGHYADTAPLGLQKYNTADGLFTIIYADSVFDNLFSGFSKDSRQPPLICTTSNDADALETEAQKLMRGLGISGSILNIQARLQQSRNLIMVVDVFSFGFITLISLITVANVFNTISTNINLRRREFAMLKSIGMTPSGFSRMINFECIFYGLKALLFGLPVSLLVCWLINKSMGEGVDMSLLIPWTSVIIAVVAVFAIVFITMMYAMSKVRKENIVDALKNENL